MIDYFDSTNRLQDYASYIIWLRQWFPSNLKVPFCDEGYEYVFELPSDLSQKELENYLLTSFDEWRRSSKTNLVWAGKENKENQMLTKDT